MYLIKLYKTDLNHLVLQDSRLVLIEDETELQSVIRLSEQAGYKLQSLETINLDFSNDFIKMLKRDTKPKNLVFGKKGRK